MEARNINAKVSRTAVATRRRLVENAARRSRGRAGAPGSVMAESAGGEITSLLARMAAGDSAAEAELFVAIQRDLRERAHRLLRSQPRGHTLETDGLVNEAYLRLVGSRETAWKDRGHFLAVAARAMRCVLVDHARGRQRIKRRAEGHEVPLDALCARYEERAIDLLLLHEALERLATVDSRAAAIVEMRFFGGMSLPEISTALGAALRTVERDWEHARAWLHGEMT